MRRDPSNMTFEQVIESMKTRPVYVDLQPGDGTKYELVLLRYHGSIAVMKLDGRPTPGATYFTLGTGVAGIEQLTGPNKWSQHLLGWWLGLVFEALYP